MLLMTSSLQAAVRSSIKYQTADKYTNIVDDNGDGENEDYTFKTMVQLHFLTFRLNNYAQADGLLYCKTDYQKAILAKNAQISL